MSIQSAGHSHAPNRVARIESTRAALRDAAGARAEGAREGDVESFPRSRLFQLALSPRYRWVTAAAAAAGVIVAWNRLPGRRVGLLVGALSLARRMRK